MPTYFAAGGIDAYELSPTQPRAAGDAAVEIGTSAAAYADAVLIDPATGAVASLKRLWTHVALAPAYGTYDRGRFPITWMTAAGVDAVQAEGNANRGMTFRFRGPDGAWRTAGDFPALNSGALDALIVVDGSEGRIALFWNGGLLLDLKGIDTSGIGNVGRLRFRGASGYDGQTIRDVIAASYGTIGHTVRVRRPTAAGAAADWSGDVAAIGKAALDDTTTIGATDVGQMATYTGPALSATPAGNIVKAVAIGARLRNDDGDAPQNVRALLRVDGKLYRGGYAARIGPGFAGSLTIFDGDPVTGGAWRAIDHANGEFGFEALA